MKNGFIILIVFLTGCSNSQKQSPDASSVIQADKDFSSLSQQKGRNFAFLQYMDTSAVLLRSNHSPITGNDTRKFFESSDTSYTLTWEPQTGFISSAADIAYTYGIYSFKLKGTDTTEQGTYVTVWKKQPDGSWKFVLDTGNPGLDKRKQ